MVASLDQRYDARAQTSVTVDLLEALCEESRQLADMSREIVADAQAQVALATFLCAQARAEIAKHRSISAVRTSGRG